MKGQPPDEGKIDVPLRLLDTKSRVMMGPAGGRAARGDAVPRRPAAARARAVRGAAADRAAAPDPRALAPLGHPIVGDKLYGASEALFMRACEEPLTPELLACFDGLPRHALHAHRLTFPHPAGQPVTIESPLPADLRAYIDELAR